MKKLLKMSESNYKIADLVQEIDCIRSIIVDNVNTSIVVTDENGLIVVDTTVNDLATYNELISCLFHDCNYSINDILTKLNLYLTYGNSLEDLEIYKISIDTNHKFKCKIPINGVFQYISVSLQGIQKDESKNDDLPVLKIRYHDEKYGELEEIKKIEIGDWIDLYTAENVNVTPGTYVKIPLGISVSIPHGYTMLLAPRSSTFSKYNLILTNSIGIIDESYCGDQDMLYALMFSPLRENDLKVYVDEKVLLPYVIHKGTRLVQFTLVKQTDFSMTKVDKLDGPNRGGIGSTGN